MWLNWLVFCDCSFQSVRSLMEKDKRLMESSWKEKLTEGETDSCSDGRAMLSSVQFSSVAQSCATLCDPWTVAHQAPLSMGFSRQEYWSGLPFPSPGDLPDPGIKPTSPTLQADTLTSAPPGKPQFQIWYFHAYLNFPERPRGLH